MEPIQFKQANVVFGEEQDEYNSLPAHLDEEKGIVTVCYKLSLEEVRSLIEDGEIYLQVMTFGNPLQPLKMLTKNPLEENE